MKTIFVFGDSLSEGVAITPRQAWPMLLVEKLRLIGPNFRVINASASGGTTEGGLRRLPPHLEHPIDIFILELGINDAFNGIPLEQTRANLQSIIDQVKARNPKASIVVVGIQFPIAAPDSEYAAAFVKMFGELAEKAFIRTPPDIKFWWKMSGACLNRSRGRWARNNAARLFCRHPERKRGTSPIVS